MKKTNLYPAFILLMIASFIGFLAWSAMRASDSGPQVTDADYYSKGLRYTSTVLEKRAAAVLGWRVDTQLSGRTLRLKVPPTFAIRWLVPRLARFHALHRDADVQITTSHQKVDFLRDDIDACIQWSTRPQQGGRFHRLFGEILLPVCSRAWLARSLALREPADLREHVLLCSLHRPRDWPTWLQAARLEGLDGNSGLKFENSALAYQAALDGMGVVMAQRAFVDEDLREGRLVAPLALRVPSDDAYFLGLPSDRTTAPIVETFHGWIMREAAQTEQAQLAAMAAEGT